MQLDEQARQLRQYVRRFERFEGVLNLNIDRYLDECCYAKYFAEHADSHSIASPGGSSM